ncbi:MAG: hypothetical protein ACHRXM_04675 [Isosphaerales bacterium]
MHDYDKSTKWLIQHHGDAILRLAGVRDIAAWTPLQAEPVLARRLPDGFIEVRHVGETEPDPYVVEVASYPDARVADQVVDDTALVRLDRRVLPEVVVLFLHPKGNVEAAGSADLRSRQGCTSLQLSWRVVKLWEVPADGLLAAGDVGLIPWVPLTRFDGPPEPIFRECRARIDRDAQPEERESLLVVTHFLAGLRYNDWRLFEILGGRQVMIESQSPILQELEAEWTRRATRKTTQRTILKLLGIRFGLAANDIEGQLHDIDDDVRLNELFESAATCPDLNSFRKQLVT